MLNENKQIFTPQFSHRSTGDVTLMLNIDLFNMYIPDYVFSVSIEIIVRLISQDCIGW